MGSSGALTVNSTQSIEAEAEWDLEKAAFAPFRTQTAVIEFHEGFPIDVKDQKVRDAIVIDFIGADSESKVVILRPERNVGEVTGIYADAVSILTSLEELGAPQEDIIEELLNLGKLYNSFSTIENREKMRAILPLVGELKDEASEEDSPPLEHFLILKESNRGKSAQFTCESVSLDQACSNENSSIAISTVKGEQPYNSQKESLDLFCNQHFKGDFDDVSLFSQHGHLRSDLEDDVLTTQIPWFTGLITDINSVQKHLIDVVASPSGLLALDPDCTDFLPTSMNRLTSSTRCNPNIASSGGTILHFFDQAIKRSDKILDLLDERVEDISYKAHTRRLTPQVLSDEVDTLKRSLRYFVRKTKEMASHTLGILSEAYDDNPSFFNKKDPTHKLQHLQNKVLRLVQRGDESLIQLREVEDTFDRLEKANTDFTIKLFTIFVGYTAPPILADLYCRFFLKHEDYRLMLAAIGVAITAHIGTYFSKWRRRA